MKRSTLFTLWAVLLTAATATADLLPPKGIVQVTPRVRFAGVEKYPDHVFYVKLSTGRVKLGSPMRFEVKNAEPFSLTGTDRRLGDMYLLALDRKEFDKRKSDDATLIWLTEKAPGVLSAALSVPPTYGSDKDKVVPVTEYSVAITDGKLSAEQKAKAKSSSALDTDDGPLRPWMTGTACALSLACLGVWFVRRRPRMA